MLRKVITIAKKDKPLVLSLILIVSLLVMGFIVKEYISGDNILEPQQTLLISLTTTIFVFIVSKMTSITTLYRKYINIEGNYVSYSYKSDDLKDVHQDIYYELRDIKNNAAVRLKYIGGNSFVITIDDGTYKWQGDFVMVSSNKADISWWYLKPDKMRYSFGYKTAVIRIECNNLHIVLFGEDRSRFGREFLMRETE